MEDITESIDNGKDVDIVYLDFSKAFDKVAHRRLIKKLENYGITGTLLNWIQDFRSNRKQRVVITGDHQTGQTLHQESRKEVSWGQFCSWYILMIYQEQ